MSNILSTTKTVEEYQEKNLFFTGEPGVIDTIHKKYPKIWDLYKEMKSLDWDENEFDYSTCFGDFKSVDKDISEMMIETLAFQWEADSVASQFPLVLIAPFNPCIEVVEAETAIQANELVHANTYSEIVRMSFENPSEVLADVLGNLESVKRLELVNSKLAEFAKVSLEHRVNGVSESLGATRLIEYYFIMLLLERIQFMASFAITFTICKSGPFAAIGQAVKKIAQDELEVHCEYRKAVLTELSKEYPEEYEKAHDTLLALFKEVVNSEMVWTEHLFKDRALVGTSEKLIKEWVLFNAKDVARFIGFTKEETGEFTFPRSNPMPFLEDWFNMNIQQAAPQEQDIAAYKVNVISRDDDNVTFDF